MPASRMATILTLFLLATSLPVVASTMGSKRVPCSYRHLQNASLNISGVCQVHYGVIAPRGEGYRRVTWPDGVITTITIPAGGAPGKEGAARIDHYPASATLKCGQEVFKIFGNTLELQGDFCR